MKVFISYSRQDLTLARELTEALAAAGIEPWLDTFEVYPGDNWQLETGKALAEADAMIVLVSPDWLASEWTQRELQYAIGQERFEGRVIPLLARPVVPESLPWLLRELHFFTLKPGNTPEIAGQIALQLKADKKPALAGSY